MTLGIAEFNNGGKPAKTKKAPSKKKAAPSKKKAAQKKK